MNTALVVAAGSGLRMGSAVRKQYLEISGLPIVAHTLRIFDLCPQIGRIYLAVPEADFAFCRERILSAIALRTPLNLVPGGEVRQASVRNGLSAMDPATEVVVIHDGVRPFITPDQVSACIQEAAVHDACILGVPVTDTLKSVSAAGTISQTLDRRHIWQAQTPQAFRYALILEAHARARREGIGATDDASLLEEMGKPVRIIPGHRNNIKITTPEDLLLAEALMSIRRTREAERP
jgi:2-C-methyl-D-erythritol 4-phosphate cytidylyltransferase